MKEAPSPKTNERLRARAAAALFAFVAVSAVSAVVLLAAQERSRRRIGAEYQAYQLAADLLRAVDAEDYQSISRTPGLRAFGVFTRRGEALFRYGELPASIDTTDGNAPARFDKDVVTLLRMMGAPQNAPRGRALFGSADQPGMGMGMMAGTRFVYVALDASAIRSGERLLYSMAAIFACAVAGAFALLFSLARSVEAYREREGRNRELLALGEAARTLAHEIKNPLGVMKIQVALLRKKTGDEAREGLRIIEEEADRLSLMASRVKAFLQADDGDPRSLSVAGTLNAFAARYGDQLSVSVEPSAEHARVRIDPLRFDQILDNLVSNAADSMAGLPFVPPLLRAESSRGRVRISVADKGCGIPSSDAGRVYDLFFTTKAAGAGIGLALAKRYAEAARGGLRHRSGQVGGTVFTLELPAENEGAQQ